MRRRRSTMSGHAGAMREARASRVLDGQAVMILLAIGVLCQSSLTALSSALPVGNHDRRKATRSLTPKVWI